MGRRSSGIPAQESFRSSAEMQLNVIARLI